MKNLKIAMLAYALFFAYCSTAQSTYDSYERNSQEEMPREQDKCYADCIISDKYETYYDTIAVYEKDEEIFDEHRTYTVYSDYKSKWVQEKVKNCRSTNPDDCMVWCMKEVPTSSKEKETFVVIDTTTLDVMKYVLGERRELVSKGGYKEKVEVICKKDLTTDLINEICLSLRSIGYECDESNNTYSVSMKKQLIQFQRDNSLPSGGLNIATLEALGVL